MANSQNIISELEKMIESIPPLDDSKIPVKMYCNEKGFEKLTDLCYERKKEDNLFSSAGEVAVIVLSYILDGKALVEFKDGSVQVMDL